MDRPPRSTKLLIFGFRSLCGSSDGGAYEALVNLCNQALNALRADDVATNLNEGLRCEEDQIEFVYSSTISLMYDWSNSGSSNRHSMGPVCATPPILVVRKDAIKGYKAEQGDAKSGVVGVKDYKFDPSDAPIAPMSTRIELKDVLGCIELKCCESKLEQPQGSETSICECLTRSQSRLAANSRVSLSHTEFLHAVRITKHITG